ncbi:hypothetical protein AJ79_02521 [Helicocarpus griseus UAMH5409]|uniref:Phytanoyl-CoA dioxygenase n=1 Tax=Helicocarpus griseus UAMH5409 TaxID=1447875 RepID=A0A2B7Y2E1_9EURO|nr:hypothetical protein AJ79_02521 [Helicocarpus griseus UAMH5409]
MAEQESYALTPEQIEHFLEHGYLHLKNCFSREKAAEWTKDIWTRLGYSPDDPSTWVRERINMPWHRGEHVSTFAPKAWAAICQLIGGAERFKDTEVAKWKDGFIVNLGTPGGESSWIPPKQLDNWHVDGDFFMHFLDSPEQALLVTPLFTDIKERGGGTMICTDGIDVIAKHLYEHPEGVTPRMRPRNQTSPGEKVGLEFYINVVQNCSNFVEVTGEVGDVYLMHPLMLHSASRNALRIPRVITNPPVSIKEPFNFNRAEGDPYSLVEQKTLRALGRPEGLPGWKIVGEREEVVPERVRVQQRMKEMELRRLRGEKVDDAAASRSGMGLRNDWDRAEEPSAAA